MIEVKLGEKLLHQTQQYYDRMLSSIGDKKRMLQHVVGSTVVDMGCGDGALVSYLLSQGYRGYGVDAAHASVEQTLIHPELKNHIYETYAHQISEFFAEGTIDTILSSSLLHEVYSYGLPGSSPLSLEAVNTTLSAWFKALSAGGRVIIRDGIIPENWNQMVSIRFKNNSRVENGKDMVAEYLHSIPFRGSGMLSDYRTVNLLQTGFEEFSGSYESIMEFLYTFNWGYEAYERETHELYGVFTLQEYKDVAASHGFDVLEAFEYVQPGYEKFLNFKVDVIRKGELVGLPSTNAILVLQKK